MHRFYFDSCDMYDNEIRITGGDVNHIKNVLRMKDGDRVVACDGSNMDYYCVIKCVTEDEILLEVESTSDSGTELSGRITLFQALPKSDKMELIVQKAVELGVYEVVPVNTKRCVVKLDEKKQKKKTERWQTIAESAAKQCKRGIIPEIKDPVSFKNAIDYAVNNLKFNMIPYENADGISGSEQVFNEAAKADSVGIFIGPEGGFADEEIEYALSKGLKVVTLGNRILRTETAGLCVLSILMFKMEVVNDGSIS